MSMIIIIIIQMRTQQLKHFKVITHLELYNNINNIKILL
jgi:hypothetical protein